jgi:hypothetical protein
VKVMMMMMGCGMQTSRSLGRCVLVWLVAVSFCRVLFCFRLVEIAKKKLRKCLRTLVPT